MASSFQLATLDDRAGSPERGASGHPHFFVVWESCNRIPYSLGDDDSPPTIFVDRRFEKMCVGFWKLLDGDPMISVRLPHF